ncbi:MAG: pilus assembly protein CpaE [Rhodoglobus sp.]
MSERTVPDRVSVELARALRDSGLAWRPTAGDAFIIDRVEADDEIFILSDMTVEAHHFPTGTELGFNGTTEWALDSVPVGDALWLPGEHQLRQLLGAAFVSLTAAPAVTATIDGVMRTFEADATADAYARALLALLDSLAAERLAE